MIFRLTKHQVKMIHEMIMKEFGGESIYRDEKGQLLESALNSPFQTFYGKDLNRTIIDKAEKLFYSLCNNHCFTDGNKRIASVVLIVFLSLNNVNVNFTNNELEEFTLSVADSNSRLSHDEIKQIILNHLAD